MRRLPLRDPRTGRRDETIDAADTSEVAATAARLRAAQPAWAALPIAARADHLLHLRDALGDAALATALERDTGRRRLARVEIASVAGGLAAWAGRADSLAERPAWVDGRPGASIRHQTTREPYPLVGVISPWNYPLLLMMIDAIPALLAGCAVLAKPSEITPRFAAPLARAVEAAGLADVFALLPGDAATGEALLGHVDCVCFTGSVATGRRVAVRAAERLIPACLELGGKDPLIVAASADLDAAVIAALRGSVLGTGQACQSIERIYVARALHDRFLVALTDAANAARLNWPYIDTGEIGPIIAERQADILRAQLDDARARGARVLAGGEVMDRGGLWLRPTVLTNVDHGMSVMREETFGPILPVMPFDTIEEAITLANDTEYGLSAAVFAATIEEAAAIGTRLRAGAVSLDDAALTALYHEAPKQSYGVSGLGPSRMGEDGFFRFFRRRSLIAQHGPPMPLSAFAEDG